MLPFVKGGAEYDPEDQFGRSVILFNVWPGEEPPPLDVPLDENDEDVLSSDHTTTAYPFCNSFSNWNEVQIIQKEAIRDLPFDGYGKPQELGNNS